MSQSRHLSDFDICTPTEAQMRKQIKTALRSTATPSKSQQKTALFRQRGRTTCTCSAPRTTPRTPRAASFTPVSMPGAGYEHPESQPYPPTRVESRVTLITRGDPSLRPGIFSRKDREERRKSPRIVSVKHSYTEEIGQ